MIIKNEEELKNILASALRAYSYQIGTGRGLDVYIPMLEDKPAIVTFTLQDDGNLVASATPTIMESIEYETLKEQLKDCQKTVKEQAEQIESLQAQLAESQSQTTEEEAVITTLKQPELEPEPTPEPTPKKRRKRT